MVLQLVTEDSRLLMKGFYGWFAIPCDWCNLLIYLERRRNKCHHMVKFYYPSNA